MGADDADVEESPVRAVLRLEVDDGEALAVAVAHDRVCDVSVNGDPGRE